MSINLIFNDTTIHWPSILQTMTATLEQAIHNALAEQQAIDLLELAAQNISNRLDYISLLNQAENVMKALPKRDKRRLRAYFFEIIKNAA